jgi:hypothetical protein
VSNGNSGIAETPVGLKMANVQYRNLACSTRGRILVALTAGLGVVKGTQAIRHILRMVECLSISPEGRVVHHAVALVVEPRGRFRFLRRNSRKSQAHQTRNDQVPHGFISRSPLCFEGHLTIWLVSLPELSRKHPGGL